MRLHATLPPDWEVREFRASDLAAYNGYVEALTRHVLDVEKCLQAMEDGACYTLLYRGAIVGSGGILVTQTGNGTAWLLPTDHLRQHPKVHLGFGRDLMHLAMDEWGLWRIEATCEAEDAQQANWLEHMGFIREGTRRSWLAPGADHWVYALVRGT